ncbi:MAG TPA: transketolase C-terminal domain-containing protein, partial [Candidatus Dormibacteraeota bacterium]|nr:transketolase C-terminal domain-containing protein [Candidatus Dormibacteraeota bacterium]
AIRDDNPVLFFTDMVLGYQAGEVPGSEHLVPLGSARIRRPGTDLTIVSYAKMVHTCLQAAEELAAKGISAEVIDLRTLKPLDESTILASARKTGRVVVVHEASRMCGVGAEVAAIVAEQAFASLKAPVVRVTGPDAPPPSSYALEQAFMPQPARIVAVAQELASGEHPHA